MYISLLRTAANIIGLTGLLQPLKESLRRYAHINTDECGALERFGGNKILYVQIEMVRYTQKILKTF